MNNEVLKSLIQSYIRAKDLGEFDDETYYHEKIDGYRDWLRENILDLDKLKSYSDAEYVSKFEQMYNHTDGGASSHALNLGMHFKSPESRLEIRDKFESVIAYINDPKNDCFKLLEDIRTDVSLKVPGLGDHIISSLINAKYPEVAPVNGTTKEFFSNIGEPLPSNISESQHIVNEFINNVISLSNGQLTLDDGNHIFWFAKEVDSGHEFMKNHFNVIYTEPTRKQKRLARKKVLTEEEKLAEAIAHLQAVHDQAMREKNQ